MLRMKPGIKKRWVKLLRSGKHPQTRSFLHIVKSSNYKPGYCCLGILAILAPNKLLARPDGTPCGVTRVSCDNGFVEVEGIWDERDGYPNQVTLSNKVLKWAGLGREEVEELIYMNDGVGRYAGNRQTFDQIADWIEEHL